MKTYIRELIEYGCSEGGVPDLAKSICYEWNNRFTRRLADSLYDRQLLYGRIRLSTKLWPLITDCDQEDTVLHEVAHIITYHIHGFDKIDLEGNRGHGQTWKRVAKQIGATPKRFAKNIPMAYKYCRKVTYYRLKCDCINGCVVSKTKLTRMKNNQHNTIYSCKKCNNVFESFTTIGEKDG